MKNLSAVITSAIISTILVLPFIALEIANRQNLQGEFPRTLFAFLWILQLGFVYILMQAGRSLWSGKRINSQSLLLRVPFLILIACIWTSIIVDQMPCFLGMMNCD